MKETIYIHSIATPLEQTGTNAPARGAVNLGPLGEILQHRQNLVGVIETSLGKDVIAELWLVLRDVAGTLDTRGSDEDRWRQVKVKWFEASYDQIVEPMLADVAGAFAALLVTLLIDGQALEEPVAVSSTGSKLSEHQIKSLGAVVVLVLAATMGGYIDARRLSASNIALVAIGLIALSDRSSSDPDRAVKYQVTVYS